MNHKNEKVSYYLTSLVPTTRLNDTAAQVLQMLPGRQFDSVNSVFVLDEGRKLIGIAPLSDLFSAPQNARLKDIMSAEPPVVRPDTDREDAASLAIREDLAAVPVVDSEGHFLGVFPPRAIMGVLREEHLEDLHHMAGIWHHSEAARRALLAPILNRVRYRLPWLVMGLIGSMIATSLVAQFEQTLQAHIAIAFFIPAIVYLADAVGTQSEAVAVRGLSLTEAGIGRLLLGELSTGALIGLAIAILAGLYAVAVFGQLDLAVTVGISLLCACAVATTIGLFLPWLFARSGWDPALASGPVATIIQDVLSLMIYFGVASMII
jgi:magnesium transporter